METKFSRNELKDALGHLAFDVHHFRCYSLMFREGYVFSFPPTISQAVGYALLIHLRLLLNFFYDRPRQDDCAAEHFGVLPGFAENYRPRVSSPSPEEARALSVSLNKRLAHFTATRWKENAPSMDYYQKYFAGIEMFIREFQSALPPEMAAVFAESLDEWNARHPAAPCR